MCVDIRKYTRVVIRKDGKYLFSVNEFTRAPQWKTSPYDAWWTRNINTARIVADRLNGDAVLFNPIIGMTKEAKQWTNCTST